MVFYVDSSGNIQNVNLKDKRITGIPGQISVIIKETIYIYFSPLDFSVWLVSVRVIIVYDNSCRI